VSQRKSNLASGSIERLAQVLTTTDLVDGSELDPADVRMPFNRTLSVYVDCLDMRPLPITLGGAKIARRALTNTPVSKK
jgi:hypothetical protein